ncbi:anaerobic sulfatase maturase AslB, partial [Escherichia coli]|nr:anaerobic sulfatase maturase AslB [Escherichia coli]
RNARYMTDARGQPGLNSCCAGYQRSFDQMPAYRKAMSDWLGHGRPASESMRAHLRVVSKDKSGHFVAACG